MFKKMMFLVILLLSLGSNVRALNRIDKFILQNGVSACNGEGPDCNDFYERAVQTNDYKTPVSPEFTF